jgi:hypothetical protein
MSRCSHCQYIPSRVSQGTELLQIAHPERQPHCNVADSCLWLAPSAQACLAITGYPIAGVVSITTAAIISAYLGSMGRVARSQVLIHCARTAGADSLVAGVPLIEKVWCLNISGLVLTCRNTPKRQQAWRSHHRLCECTEGCPKMPLRRWRRRRDC